MQLTYCLMGHFYDPPLNYDEVEPELQRLKNAGDPMAVAYCQRREEAAKKLADAINDTPIMRILRSAQSEPQAGRE